MSAKKVTESGEKFTNKQKNFILDNLSVAGGRMSAAEVAEGIGSTPSAVTYWFGNFRRRQKIPKGNKNSPPISYRFPE